MQSPLRYPGGKVKLYSFFVDLISRNSLFDCTYREPYAGGAGLALKLLAHGFVSRIEINDIDPAIAAFWRSVVHEPDRFCDMIYSVELSVTEWRSQRQIYASGGQGDEFALGFAAYYLNRTSRSGIIEGSGPIGGYEQKSRWGIDARFNRSTQISQVMEISRFAHLITISQIDAIEFVRDRVAEDNSLIYLDPPYYVKGKNLYKNFYQHSDHAAIATLLEEHRHANWVLSYDHVPEIIDLYQNFVPLVYDLQYSAGQVGLGKEVIYGGESIVLPESDRFRRAA